MYQEEQFESLCEELELDLENVFGNGIYFLRMAKKILVDGGERGVMEFRGGQGDFEWVLKKEVDEEDKERKEKWFHMVEDEFEIKQYVDNQYIIWIEIEKLSPFVRGEWGRFIMEEKMIEVREKMEEHLGNKRMMEKSAYVVVRMDEVEGKEYRWVIAIQPDVSKRKLKEVSVEEPYKTKWWGWQKDKGIVIDERDLKQEGKALVNVYKEIQKEYKRLLTREAVEALEDL